MIIVHKALGQVRVVTCDVCKAELVMNEWEYPMYVTEDHKLKCPICSAGYSSIGEFAREVCSNDTGKVQKEVSKTAKEA